VKTNSNTTAILVDQEFQVQQGTAAPGKSSQNVLPTSLLLVYIPTSIRSRHFSSAVINVSYSSGQTEHAHA
jgi:hypothetical protein